MDTTIDDAVVFLKTKYEFELLILYGSYANDLSNNESDIDIIGFANIPEFVHESEIINEHMLDAWIYPGKYIADIDKTIHILPCKVLIDKYGKGNKLLCDIEKERKKRKVVLKGKEKEQMNSWIAKMIKRARQDGSESDYRYNWLLYDFPELYCNYLGIYYDGPIKTIKNILRLDKEISLIYFELIGKEKNMEKVEELYKILLSRSI